MQILLDIKPEAFDALKKAFKEHFHGELTEDAMRKFVVENVNMSLQDQMCEWYNDYNFEDFFVDLDYEPIWVD